MTLQQLQQMFPGGVGLSEAPQGAQGGPQTPGGNPQNNKQQQQMFQGQPQILQIHPQLLQVSVNRRPKIIIIQIYLVILFSSYCLLL